MLTDLPDPNNPTSLTPPSAPTADASLAPGLRDSSALKAANVTSQPSMARVQAQAVQAIGELVNKAMQLGIQFPFLQEQMSMLAQIGEDSKQQIIINLGPQIDAEAQQTSQQLASQQSVSAVTPALGGLSPMPGEGI